MRSTTTEHEVARLLLEIKAVTLRPHRPYKFVSGILSPIYIDNRRIMSYPKVRNKIINFYLRLIKNKVGPQNADVISGTATSAIPFAAWIADRLGLPMVFVRPAQKKHGTESKLEGVFEKGSKVVVIEDLITTGESALSNAKTVREMGGKVEFCLAIITYGTSRAEKSFNAARIQLFTLTDFLTLVDVAIKEGYMKEEDKKLVLSWARNPEDWGRK